MFDHVTVNSGISWQSTYNLRFLQFLQFQISQNNSCILLEEMKNGPHIYFWGVKQSTNQLFIAVLVSTQYSNSVFSKAFLCMFYYIVCYAAYACVFYSAEQMKGAVHIFYHSTTLLFDSYPILYLASSPHTCPQRHIHTHTVHIHIIYSHTVNSHARHTVVCFLSFNLAGIQLVCIQGDFQIHSRRHLFP